MGIPAADSNSNLYRRPGPGLLLALAWPLLKILSLILSRSPRPGGEGGKGLVIFQSYLVGDFYMALPAILALSRHMPVTVFCRPDCLFALEGTGVTAVGFECPYHTSSGLSAYWAAFRNALALRSRFSRRGSFSGSGSGYAAAVDFDGDPRTAFLLKAAGLGPVLSYARPYAWIFDRLLSLDPAIRHQSLKNDALASAILAERGIAPEAPSGRAPEDTLNAAPGSLVLSCWTRKDTKNWPFEHWDGFLAFLHGQGRPLIMIVPPDGDAAFQAFRSHWEGRIEFLTGGLQRVSAAVRAASGVIGTDNFLGHMAAQLGKPVFWINGSSESAHVAPRGAGTTVLQLDPMPCRPCRHRCVNPVHKQCLTELRPEAAIAAAKTWLSRLA